MPIRTERPRSMATTAHTRETRQALKEPCTGTFSIEGDSYAYLAQERLRLRWSKPANLTVNGPVKYAAEKRKLFVVDEDGKEHEMEIVKKVATTQRPAEALKGEIKVSPNE